MRYFNSVMAYISERPEVSLDGNGSIVYYLCDNLDSSPRKRELTVVGKYVRRNELVLAIIPKDD